MHDMPMPGGDTMSGLVSVLMMAAMMLPSSALMLRRDRDAAAGRGEARLFRRTATVGVAYFIVWIAISLAVLPLGAMLAHVTPTTAGAIVLVAGALQFTTWKARQLECWREQSAGRGRAPSTGITPGNSLRPQLRKSDGDPAGHWRDGYARDGGRDRRDHGRTFRGR